jgi:hypothetical protein
MTVFPCRMQELDELRHTLIEIREYEGQSIATFPNGNFIFPSELAERLRPLIGHKIAILRLCGWHIRDLTQEADDAAR